MITRNILLLSLAATALATPASSGFYLGAQAGGSLMIGTLNIADQNNQSTASNTRDMGLGYGAQLGYTYQFANSKLFVLGEGYYIKKAGKPKVYWLSFQSDPTTPGSFSLQSTSNYGVALGIGGYLNPKFGLYGKVGFEHKGLKTDYKLPSQSTYTNGTAQSIWTISPGAGFSYKITDSIAINPEYSYALGRKFKILGQTTNPDGSITKSIYFTPTEHRLMLKLNYLFG